MTADDEDARWLVGDGPAEPPEDAPRPRAPTTCRRPADAAWPPYLPTSCPSARTPSRLRQCGSPTSTSTRSSPAAIRPVPSSSVLPSGLEDDRSWMLVDREFRMVSAREVHQLFTVVADTPATDPTLTHDLRLRAPGHPDLVVAHPFGARLPVHLFSLDLEAVPVGTEADEWLQARSSATTYASCGATTRRVAPLQPGFSEPGDHARFPELVPGHPGERGVPRPTQRLDRGDRGRARRGSSTDPLPMSRFRPNLVVDGEVPFAEDDWAEVRIGDVTLPPRQARRSLRDDDDRPDTWPPPTSRSAPSRVTDGSVATPSSPSTWCRCRAVGSRSATRSPSPDRHPRATGRVGSVIQPLQLPG